MSNRRRPGCDLSGLDARFRCDWSRGHDKRRASVADPCRRATPTVTRPLRIAWFGHGGGRRADGLSAYTHEIVSGLEARGARVRVFFHGIDGDRLPTQDGVTLAASRWKTVTFPRGKYRQTIRDELRAFQPDVIHVSWSFSLQDRYIGEIARSMGVPSSATFHVPYAPSGSVRSAVMAGLYRYHVRALGVFDHCFALSEGQKEALQKSGYPGARLTVNPNGVDTSLFTPDARQPPGPGVTVSFIGRLDPEKRVDALIEAFVGIRDGNRDRLLLVGEGSCATALQRKWGADASIEFVGALHTREDLAHILRRSSIFCLPSSAEGLSLSLLEAMAAGCAVICTDVGDHHAVVNGAGLLIANHHVRDVLPVALKSLFEDPELRQYWGKAARERVVSRYDMAAHVDTLMRHFESALRRPSGAAS